MILRLFWVLVAVGIVFSMALLLSDTTGSKRTRAFWALLLLALIWIAASLMAPAPQAPLDPGVLDFQGF